MMELEIANNDSHTCTTKIILPFILTKVKDVLPMMFIFSGNATAQIKSTRTGSLTLIGLRMSTLVLLPLLTVVFGMINGCCVKKLTVLQVNTAPTTLLIHVTLRSSPE